MFMNKYSTVQRLCILRTQITRAYSQLALHLNAFAFELDRLCHLRATAFGFACECDRNVFELYVGVRCKLLLYWADCDEELMAIWHSLTVPSLPPHSTPSTFVN